jgi:hypothetical protein
MLNLQQKWRIQKEISYGAFGQIHVYIVQKSSEPKIYAIVLAIPFRRRRKYFASSVNVINFDMTFTFSLLFLSFPLTSSITFPVVRKTDGS